MPFTCAPYLAERDGGLQQMLDVFALKAQYLEDYMSETEIFSADDGEWLTRKMLAPSSDLGHVRLGGCVLDAPCEPGRE